MINPKPLSLSHRRSEVWTESVTDAYGFRSDGGVTSLLTQSTRADYQNILNILREEGDGFDSMSDSVDEICENKWFIHVYDVHDNLN